MKSILTITLIIVLLIGIYTYAHVNRYDSHVIDRRIGILVLDKWTGKTYLSRISSHIE